MSESLKYNISPQFNNDRIYNDSSLSMDEDYSDSEIYDLKDDVPSPSKRGRGQIQNGIRRSPNKWTEEEDQKLFQLVNIYGEKKWKRISADMGGQKTGAQCAQHWKRVLSPDIRKGPWDEDEEELLLRLVNQHGSSWKKIAKRICKRTDIQCRYQYLKSLQSREVAWVPKEDEVLVKKVDEMGENLSWLEVSEYLAKLKHTNTLRTALECKTRYLQLTGKAGLLPPLNQSNVSNLNSSSAYQQQMQYNNNYNNNSYMNNMNNNNNNNNYMNNNNNNHYQMNHHNNNNNNNNNHHHQMNHYNNNNNNNNMNNNNNNNMNNNNNNNMNNNNNNMNNNMNNNNNNNNNNNMNNNNNNNNNTNNNNNNNNNKPHSLSPLSSLIDSNTSSPSFESCGTDDSNNHTPPNIFRPLHKPVISSLTSPTSSPIPTSSPPLSPPQQQQPLSSPTCNNSNINNNNNIRQPSPSPSIKQYKLLVKPSTTSSTSSNNNNNSSSSAFSINNIIDSKKEDDYDYDYNNKSIKEDNDCNEPVLKKVRSNGEFYYQPINNKLKNNNNTSYNSDNSSDDDMLPKIKNNNNNNNKQQRNNGFTFNNSSSKNNNSSPISSPFSSPHPSIEKLKATSFDFFNLESLATLASQSQIVNELAN